MSNNAPKVLLRSEQSDGQVAIVELTGGGRPPLHTHDFDEAFYVLEGDLTFKLGDDVFTRRAGELAFAPRGVPHTYANLSGAPARALLVITPAGFERYFDRIAARISGTEPPPEAAKPIPRGGHCRPATQGQRNTIVRGVRMSASARHVDVD
jgi:quercetin dioxygenase-like cupin family protein